MYVCTLTRHISVMLAVAAGSVLANPKEALSFTLSHLMMLT